MCNLHEISIAHCSLWAQQVVPVPARVWEASPSHDSTTTTMNPTKLSSKETRFDWPLCHDAENFILNGLEAFTKRNSFARRLEERMRSETGTLLLDWVDHVVVPMHE